MNSRLKPPSLSLLALAAASTGTLYWAAFQEESLFFVVCASVCTVLVVDLVRIKIAALEEGK